MSIGDGFDGVLRAALAGTPWAYERLYRDLSPTVLGYLRLQGASEPEDLTSEVFIGVFTGLGGFAGSEAQFRSWVFTIAHRRLVDERRRRNCRPVADGSPRAWAHADTDVGDVEEDALRAMSAQRVRSLCLTLAPDQRDVLLLRLVSGFTVEQVAEVMGRSPGAVKALQRRGLSALRQIVGHQTSLDPGVPL